jgi:hypothetical protein
VTYIYFAIAHDTPLSVREGARARVADRFGGIPWTTELVSVEDYGRLYRMREIDSP